MRVLVLGGDGYLGWPTAMYFAANGHEVTVVDNYLRRNLSRETCSEALMPTLNLHDRANLFHAVTNKIVDVRIGDCSDYRVLSSIVEAVQPEAIIHYAEQPSAPYSMMGFDEAERTFKNNLCVTFNVIWSVLKTVPDCHIIKLGTMGEYGTPNIDIEEGWIEINHKGRHDTFLYPRQAGSLYHTTKILDTDLLWFYVRSYGLRVSDLMQGPVYGLSTQETDMSIQLNTYFNYDDIFGTVVNRFLAQAVAGIPLTVYGKGGQTRGYLNIKDTIQCVELAMSNPVKKGELRILNQFTEQFTVNEIAEKVMNVGNAMGLKVKVQSISNPRNEKENHYYNAKHRGLLDMGLDPHYMTEEVVADMLERVLEYKSAIDNKKIMPRVKWS